MRCTYLVIEGFATSFNSPASNRHTAAATERDTGHTHTSERAISPTFCETSNYNTYAPVHNSTLRSQGLQVLLSAREEV